MCYFQVVRKGQAGICTTLHGTAAGHAVAARGGLRVAGPMNREPTARPQVAAETPVLRSGGGCQVVLLFKEPMPREPASAGPVSGEPSTSGAPGAPEVPGASGGSSRKSADGAKNRLPVTAVEKSRMRSVLPGGSPMNMWSSISSVTLGVAP